MPDRPSAGGRSLGMRLVVLTITEKLEVCKAAKRGQSLSSLATEYTIEKATESTISIAEVRGKLKDFQTELHDGDCVTQTDSVCV